ncbi:PREDICTED: transcription factor GTE12-like [Camelina sativa]|uniref:Transcription factor GTE12-like n=1 Tax=Camelina sativa TaxID=90675 RepID=A0ABM0WK72_CAMSA|nr:PREDICTED: transcription factor GTE12-like [Camelina sativa]
MVTETKLRLRICLGSEVNQSRKKRKAEEQRDDDLENTKKQKLDVDGESSSSMYDMCLKVLKSMRDEWFGSRFEELVIENPNYFSVISKPMDFVTIKSKLAKNLYVSIAKEFPKDVRLVYENAIRYYPPENSLHKNAKKLMRVFEVRWEPVIKKKACESFYLDQKVSSLSKSPAVLKEDKPETESKFDPKALRAAAIRIRFADTIAKARYRKELIDESGGSNNKADVMMGMQKAKQLLETRQREEEARIESETRAARLKVLCRERLALEELAEEAKFNVVNNLETEKDMVKLCGGSYLARTRSLQELGLRLIFEDYWPELEEIKEEGEI